MQEDDPNNEDWMLLSQNFQLKRKIISAQLISKDIKVGGLTEVVRMSWSNIIILNNTSDGL